jgi:membrane associated rhomboid family serine protease
MKAVFRNFFSALSNGAYLLLLLYAVGYPLAMAGRYAGAFELYQWLDLSPPLIWRGEIWRLATYAFLPNGIVDWAVSLFWMATVVGVLGRKWSTREIWTYSLITIMAGALVLAIALPGRRKGVVVGNAALVFGLLAAWYRLNGRERFVMLGIGEMPVRQAVVIIAIIQLLISFLCLGWFVTIAMICGGGAGWLYLCLRDKRALNRRSGSVNTERIPRLEL